MKSLSGYICLHRKILDWEWHDDPNTFTVFMHLLLLASWKDTEWRGIPIKRGQVITSRSSLSKETGLSERQVRTARKHLEKTGEVTVNATKRYMLVTIVNYDLYQGGNDKRDQDEDQQTANERSNDRPAESQSDDHIVISIETKKEKKERATAVPLTHSHSIPPTLSEVQTYVAELNSKTSAETFFDYYEASGWIRSDGQPIKDWKAQFRTFEKRKKDEKKTGRRVEPDWIT